MIWARPSRAYFAEAAGDWSGRACDLNQAAAPTHHELPRHRAGSTVRGRRRLGPTEPATQRDGGREAATCPTGQGCSTRQTRRCVRPHVEGVAGRTLARERIFDRATSMPPGRGVDPLEHEVLWRLGFSIARQPKQHVDLELVPRDQLVARAHKALPRLAQ